MALSEREFTPPDTLIIKNPRQKLIRTALDEFPFLPYRWDAKFTCGKPRLPEASAKEYIVGLEEANIAPFTYLAHIYDAEAGGLVPQFSQDRSNLDSIGLRPLTSREFSEGKKPHQIHFINQGEKAFDDLRKNFMGFLMGTGMKYSLEEARIFVGLHDLSDHLLITPDKIGLRGRFNMPIRDDGSVGLPNQVAVRSFFMDLKEQHALAA